MQVTSTSGVGSWQELDAQRAKAEADIQATEAKWEDVEMEEPTKRSSSSGRSRREKAAAARRKSNHTPLFQNNAALANLQRKDSVSISNNGRMAQLIERLQAQKEAILEQKNALVEKTLDSGMTLEDIEEPLEAFDEQLLSLEEQLSDLMNQQAQVQLAKQEKEKPSPLEASIPPETEEEQDARRIGELSQLSVASEFSGIVMQAAQKVEGEANVRQDELESDKLGIDIRHSRLKIRRAEQMFEYGRAADTSAETKYYSHARSTYSKQIREVEREATDRLDEITYLAASQNDEVQRSLNEDPETKDTEERDPLAGLRHQPFETRA